MYVTFKLKDVFMDMHIYILQQEAESPMISLYFLLNI